MTGWKKIVITAAAAVLVRSALAAMAFFPQPERICHAVSRWDAENSDLLHPMSLAYDGSHVYVSDTEHQAVKKFDSNGKVIASFAGFRQPVDVAASSEFLYVADFQADRITKLTKEGKTVASWGTRGKGPGEFDAPSGIAVDADGLVYVADFYNHRIQQFKPDGTFIRQWGSNGKGVGKFHYPSGLSVAGNALYVADTYNHRLQQFTLDGTHLLTWGGTGYGLSGKFAGWFRLAKAVTTDAKGNIYATDAFNARVQQFDPDHSLHTVWTTTDQSAAAIRYPSGITIGPDKRVLVTDFFENKVLQLQCQ